MSPEILESSETRSVSRNGVSKLRFNEVGVMEDDKETFATLDNLLNSLGFEVYSIENVDEAINLAKTKKIRNYILDVRTGRDTQEEGLDALERLKLLDPSIFVGIYSGYPHKRKAKRLKADVFQSKSHDKKADILSIVDCLLAHGIFQIALLRDNLKSINVPDSLDSTHSTNPDTFTSDNLSQIDENFITYQKLISQPQWLHQHKNYYIAIWKGELIGKSKEKNNLLDEMISKYPNERFLFTRIEEQDTVLDIPSPFYVE